MIKEYQVVSKDKIDTISGYSGLAFGDEGCIYRAFNESWKELADKAQNDGLTLRYLTPIVPERYIDQLFEYIKKISTELKIKVTFNDYGLLFLCRHFIEEERIIPVMGRILSRSFSECPWHKELLKDEELELVNAAVGSAFSHQAKLNLIKDYNIKEIEFNLQDVTALTGFKDLRLTTYATNKIIAVGRICYLARLYEMKLPECSKDARCSNKINIKLNKMWGKKRLMYEEPSEHMKGYFNNLYINGNMVFEHITTDIEKDLLNGFNTVIL